MVKNPFQKIMSFKCVPVINLPLTFIIYQCIYGLFKTPYIPGPDALIFLSY